jgi:hypothetical protein
LAFLPPFTTAEVHHRRGDRRSSPRHRAGIWAAPYWLAGL